MMEHSTLSIMTNFSKILYTIADYDLYLKRTIVTRYCHKTYVLQLLSSIDEKETNTWH